MVTSDGTIRQATINASAVGKVDAAFTVTGAVAGEKYIYGFYPYQTNVKYADGKLKGVCLNNKRTFIKNETEAEGSTLDGYGLTFNTNEMHMVAKPDANGNLVFKCSCGVIELQLTGDKADNYYNFSLHSDSKEISAYGTVDMTAANPVFVPYNMATYSYNTIQAKEYGTHTAYMKGAENNGVGVSVNNTGTTKLFFVVPVGTYDDLEIMVACPRLCVIKKASKPHTVKRNVILAFNPINVNQVSNLYSGSDVTDLSADGVGYTYLVPTSASPKKYKFKALMVGDTKEFMLPDGTLINPNAETNKTSTNQNYNVTYVYAEDSEGVITDLRREGDYVYFTASKPGNAIIQIAATDVSRFNQFHIWVSDAADQSLPGGHVFLNCNLGATYIPKSLAEASAMTNEQLWRSAGCHYQWGNPTPRPSRTSTMPPADFTSTSVGNTNWNGAGGWILHPWATDPYSLRMFASGANAADLVRSRMYWNFLSNVTSSYADSGTLVWWQADKDKYGDLRFGENALWQETKTQFDPCPVGYRVPSKQEIADAFTNNGSHTSKQYKIAPGAAGQYYTYNSQFVFVPWQGFRRSTNAAMFNYAWSNYPRTGWWYFDSSLTSTDDMITKYSGLNIYVYKDNKDNQQNVSDVQFAKNAVYPACELRIGGTGWWAANCNSSNDVKAPEISIFRYPVNLCMGVRCVRESALASSASVAPSYNVDAESGL